MRRSILICALVVLPVGLALVQCSSTPVAGSETTNGMTVAAMGDTIMGTAAPSTVVSVYSSDYLPHAGQGFADTLTVGSGGTYLLTGLPAGFYTVIALDPLTGLGALVGQVPVQQRDEMFADTLVLDSLGTVEGTVMLDTAVQAGAVVYVPGTPYFDSTDVAGYFAITDMPTGEYRLITDYSPVFGDPLYADSADVSLGTGGTWTQVFHLQLIP